MKDREQEELLQRVYEIAEENNTMLRKMRRSRIIGGIFKIVLWFLILGGGVWGYVEFVHPLLQYVLNSLQGIQQTGEQMTNVSNLPPELKAILQKFGIDLGQ